MKSYTGIRTEEGTEVTVTDEKGTRPLDPRLDLRRHSPTGFSHGYSGSGPAQLALALLADVLGEEAAQKHYQSYKFKVIGRIEGDSFELSEDDIRRSVEQIEAERGRGR